jgi:translation elongation factor EF-Tu-like GTPase
MTSKPHFIALLTYILTGDERRTPVSSGYRPGIKFDFYHDQFPAIQNFIDTDLVFPGDSVTAEITLVNTEYFKGKIYGGLEFDFFEGQLLIGHGVITKLLDPV